jgi:hypothetical protein
MKSCLINNFLSDLLRLQYFFLKLILTFDLQETNVIDVTHTIHDFLQP